LTHIDARYSPPPHAPSCTFDARHSPPPAPPVVEVVEEDAAQAARLLAVLDLEVLVTPLLELGVERRVVPGGVVGEGMTGDVCVEVAGVGGGVVG
jgi:hypothetical protein